MRRACSMRKSSPGKPKPGRRQKPHRFSQRASCAALRLRPSASSRQLIRQFADRAQRPRIAAQAQSLFQLGRQLLRFERSPSENTAGIRASAAASASSLITAAGFREHSLRGSLAQLELQAPAMVADLGIRPDFERAHFRQLRAQLHGHHPLARFAEAQNRASGACR